MALVWHEKSSRTALQTSSINLTHTLLVQTQTEIRGKPEILRLLWDIVVFRLVAYLLNMTCLILQLLYKIANIYMNFRINLTKVYINY
jgi:hypothetical protein